MSYGGWGTGARAVSSSDVFTAPDTYEEDLIFRETGDAGADGRLRINHETGKLEWADGTNPADFYLERFSLGLATGGDLKFATTGRGVIDNSGTRVLDFTSAAAQRVTSEQGHKVVAKGAADVALVVQGVASQSANLQEWQNSAGTILVRVKNDGRACIGAGSAASPAIQFQSDPDTGLYDIGADNLGITVGGSKILDLKNNAAVLEIGFLGAAPVPRQAAVTSPVSDISGTKAAIDALITRLENYGLLVPN